MAEIKKFVKRSFEALIKLFEDAKRIASVREDELKAQIRELRRQLISEKRLPGVSVKEFEELKIEVRLLKENNEIQLRKNTVGAPATVEETGRSGFDVTPVNAIFARLEALENSYVEGLKQGIKETAQLQIRIENECQAIADSKLKHYVNISEPSNNTVEKANENFLKNVKETRDRIVQKLNDLSASYQDFERRYMPEVIDLESTNNGEGNPQQQLTNNQEVAQKKVPFESVSSDSSGSEATDDECNNEQQQGYYHQNPNATMPILNFNFEQALNEAWENYTNPKSQLSNDDFELEHTSSANSNYGIEHGRNTEIAGSSRYYYCKCGSIFGNDLDLEAHINSYQSNHSMFEDTPPSGLFTDTAASSGDGSFVLPNEGNLGPIDQLYYPGRNYYSEMEIGMENASSQYLEPEDFEGQLEGQLSVKCLDDDYNISRSLSETTVAIYCSVKNTTDHILFCLGQFTKLKDSDLSVFCRGCRPFTKEFWLTLVLEANLSRNIVADVLVYNIDDDGTVWDEPLARKLNFTLPAGESSRMMKPGIVKIKTEYHTESYETGTKRIMNTENHIFGCGKNLSVLIRVNIKNNN